MLSRGEVHDPQIGFITLTQVKVSPDLQLARVFYTSLGGPEDFKEPAFRALLKRAMEWAELPEPTVKEAP